MEENFRKYNFYGRRSSKKLKKSHKIYIDEILPTLNLENQDVFEKTFKKYNEIWIEVGFGSGEHLVNIAKLNPKVYFIGCEPFIDGVAKLITKMVNNKIENIRIYTKDFRELMNLIPSSSISKIFLLFPDPWPKKRHHKRRLINNEVVEELSRILKINSYFYTATDVKDYFNEIKNKFLLSSKFLEDKSFKYSNGDRWLGWVQTRYERKGVIEGREPIYASFQKIK